jgi:tetratricopeptide (TPR) repeat protein
MRWIIILLAILVLAIPQSQANAEKKVALVVGNADYKDQVLGPLPNSGSDAKIVANALKRAGFVLIGDGPQIDLDRTKFGDAVATLGIMAKDADIVVFYFSGHGIQASSRNFLIPTKLANISRESLPFNSINANYVLEVMEKSDAHVKVMLLDSCRKPFQGFGDGFDAMRSERAGTVIGFAAQLNGTASPGRMGGNSPYAKALETYLQVRGLEIYNLINEVGLAVIDETQGYQRPWISQSPVKGKVYFNPPPSGVPLPAVANTGESSVQTGAAIPFVQRAYPLLDLKEYKSARAILTQAIETEPGSPVARSYRGFAWYLDGNSKRPADAVADYRKALSDLDAAVQIDPVSSPTRRHRGDANLSMYAALKRTGQGTNNFLDRAIDDLKAAAVLDPRSKRNAYSLGQAYLVKGSYDLAIESFQNAIARDTSYAAPYSGLCFAYRMKGNKNSASTNARLASEKDNDLKSEPCLTKAAAVDLDRRDR